MLTLILANNYVLMFVGWEGVGLCSYLLIGFYFHRKSASDAANKAFIINRIGDAGFLLGTFFIAWYFGSVRYVDVNLLARSGHFAIGDPIITAATLLLFVGACGKSAQLPLYVWLPDAMEGPTPVSALIHAATMVTAGVYMVARSNALFVLAPKSMNIVAIVGALTAIFAASIGLVQNDIKRVLAYSTVSQLGYMFLALGVGAFAAGVFHVFTHAFFKALLFLGAGSVIHAMSGEQDMRNMGASARRFRSPSAPCSSHSRHRRHSALRRLLLQRRNPLADVDERRRRVPHPVGHRVSHRADDVVLHVPPDLSHVFQQAAHEPRGRAPHSRVAEVDDCAADHSCTDVGIRRIARMAAQPRWLRPLREVSGAVFAAARLTCLSNKAKLDNLPPEKKKKNTPVRRNIADGLVGRRSRLGLVYGVARSYGNADKGYSEPIAAAAPPVYKTLLNKYYVDEGYDYVFTGRRKLGDTRLGVLGLGEASSWFDTHVVDGLVNFAGWLTRAHRRLSPVGGTSGSLTASASTARRPSREC